MTRQKQSFWGRRPAALLFPLFYLGVFFLYPFLKLLVISLKKSVPSVLAEKGSLRALENTLVISLGVTALSLLIGFYLAWLVSRTDFGHRKLMDVLVAAGFAAPSYAIGLSLILFFGKNGLLERLFGWEICPYSRLSVILTLTAHLYPMAYLALRNLLEQEDAELLQAARLSGASRFEAFRDVTLPLMAPGFLQAGLFISGKSMANFSVPALLLMPAREETLCTRIYRSLNALSLGRAGRLSLLLFSISALLHLAGRRLCRPYGAPGEGRREKEPLKHPHLHVFLVGLLLFFTGIFPILGLFCSSFLKSWGLPFRREFLTLMNWKRLFTDPLSRRAFANSLCYGGLASLLSILVASLVSLESAFRPGKLADALELLASWPMVFPNMLIALEAVFSFSAPPLDLYGTGAIIVVSWSLLFLPLSLKQIRGLAETLDPFELKAARLSGAGAFRAFWDILFPRLWPGMLSSLYLALVISLREIPISLMLHAPGTETVGVLLYNMRSNSGGLEQTSAVASFVILSSLLLHLLLKGVPRERH